MIRLIVNFVAVVILVSSCSKSNDVFLEEDDKTALTIDSIDRRVIADLYYALNGDQWTTKWDLKAPQTWAGVTIAFDEAHNVYRVIELRLHDQKMYGVIPQSIGELKYLHTLDILGPGINGELPDSFRDLKALRYLGINSTFLNSSIWRPISELKGLEWLIVEGHHFGTNVPKQLCQLVNLKLLQLRNNQFNGAISDDLLNMQCDICLEYNQIDSLSDAYWSTKGMINLNFNNLSGVISKDIQSLPYFESKFGISVGVQNEGFGYVLEK